MAFLNAVGGQAPQGATVGDTIRTQGGNYTIVSPGTAGSDYNPQSGHWSVKAGDVNEFSGLVSSAKSLTDSNTRNMQDAANIANLVSAESSAKAMDFSAQEAEKQREWSKMMSDTAYQRQVEDLKSAGLNPILGFMGSGGATTPSGASASGHSYTGQKADVDTNASMVMSSIFNALTQQETAIDVAKINAETMLKTAQLSSAANMYGADMLYKGSIDTRNPLYQLANEFFSGNSARSVSGAFNSLRSVFDLLPFGKIGELGSSATSYMQDRVSKPSVSGSRVERYRKKR